MILNQNKMRLRTLILVGIVCMTSACSEAAFDGSQPQQTGTLSVQMESEICVDNATKAVSGTPDVKDFKIEIYKYASQGLVRLYRDTYENTVDKKIALNAALPSIFWLRTTAMKREKITIVGTSSKSCWKPPRRASIKSGSSNAAL